MEEYHLEGCRKARECLLTRGVPMTTLYRTPVVSWNGEQADIEL
jgi:hypothetical protein